MSVRKNPAGDAVPRLGVRYRFVRLDQCSYRVAIRNNVEQFNQLQHGTPFAAHSLAAGGPRLMARGTPENGHLGRSPRRHSLEGGRGDRRREAGKNSAEIRSDFATVSPVMGGRQILRRLKARTRPEQWSQHVKT